MCPFSGQEFAFPSTNCIVFFQNHIAPLVCAVARLLAPSRGQAGHLVMMMLEEGVVLSNTTEARLIDETTFHQQKSVCKTLQKRKALQVEASKPFCCLSIPNFLRHQCFLFELFFSMTSTESMSPQTVLFYCVVFVLIFSKLVLFCHSPWPWLCIGCLQEL